MRHVPAITLYKGRNGDKRRMVESISRKNVL